MSNTYTCTIQDSTQARYRGFEVAWYTTTSRMCSNYPMKFKHHIWISNFVGCICCTCVIGSLPIVSSNLKTFLHTGAHDLHLDMPGCTSQPHTCIPTENKASGAAQQTSTRCLYTWVCAAKSPWTGLIPCRRTVQVSQKYAAELLLPQRTPTVSETKIVEHLLPKLTPDSHCIQLGMSKISCSRKQQQHLGITEHLT